MDIPTFYTDIAEVSLTGGILVVRILDEAPDEDAIGRHNRILTARLKGVEFSVILDVRYLEYTDHIVIEDILRYEVVEKLKVVILARCTTSAGKYGTFTVCENEQEAINQLRNFGF
jgi:hypothetical protein